MPEQKLTYISRRGRKIGRREGYRARRKFNKLSDMAMTVSPAADRVSNAGLSGIL